MTDSKFTIDERGLNSLVNGSDGVSRNEARRVGRAIVTLAKRYVGVKTGRLRKNISFRVLRFQKGYQVVVTADTPYALEHHQGTRPHVITPNNHHVMRFKSGGRVVYAQRVFHPGTRANPFLVRAMREVVR